MKIFVYENINCSSSERTCAKFSFRSSQTFLSTCNKVNAENNLLQINISCNLHFHEAAEWSNSGTPKICALLNHLRDLATTMRCAIFKNEFFRFFLFFSYDDFCSHAAASAASATAVEKQLKIIRSNIVANWIGF